MIQEAGSSEPPVPCHNLGIVYHFFNYLMAYLMKMSPLHQVVVGHFVKLLTSMEPDQSH